MLSALVENAGPRFQTSFADDRLVERIKLMSQDPLVDASVRRKLMRMLLSWQHLFRSEPTMRIAAGLYVACGGGKKSDAQVKSEAAEAYRKRREQEERERQLRMDRKAAERIQKEEDAKREKERKKKGNARPVFNFEREKPVIMSTLATSQQAATSLVNALQHVNREKESVAANGRVQTYLARVKAERKKVVRYIQLVRDEEYLGGLISANDQIILSLELYDKLAKSSDHDSDEEDNNNNELLANITGAKSAAQRAQERAEQEEAEIAVVQQRLAAAHFEESQLDALQDKQRRRIERHNSSRSLPRSSGSASGAGHMHDLMDLNFDDQEDRPPHAVMRPTSKSASSAARSSGVQNASLSDYSDYESESDDDVEAVAIAGTEGRTVAASASKAQPYDDDDLYSNHRPSIGPDSVLDYDLEGDDDPFADPQEAQTTGGSLGAGFSRHNGPREGFAAV